MYRVRQGRKQKERSNRNSMETEAIEDGPEIPRRSTHRAEGDSAASEGFGAGVGWDRCENGVRLGLVTG